MFAANPRLGLSDLDTPAQVEAELNDVITAFTERWVGKARSRDGR
jgi:hypothetical protein